MDKKTLLFTVKAIDIHAETWSGPRRLPTVTMDLQASDRYLFQSTELLRAVGKQVEIRILEEVEEEG